MITVFVAAGLAVIQSWCNMSIDSSFRPHIWSLMSWMNEKTQRREEGEQQIERVNPVNHTHGSSCCCWWWSHREFLSTSVSLFFCQRKERRMRELKGGNPFDSLNWMVLSWEFCLWWSFSQDCQKSFPENHFFLISSSYSSCVWDRIQQHDHHPNIFCLSSSSSCILSLSFPRFTVNFFPIVDHPSSSSSSSSFSNHVILSSFLSHSFLPPSVRSTIWKEERRRVEEKVNAQDDDWEDDEENITGWDNLLPFE